MAKAGTSVAKAKLNLPVNMNEQVALELQQLKDQLSKPTGNKIKMEDKVYTVAGGTTDKFDAVVLGFAHAKRLYASGYKKGSVTPSACHAVSFIEKELKPGEDVMKPPATSCGACPNSKFAANGDRPKCQTRMLVALSQVDGAGEIMLLDLPVKAIKPFETYLASVARNEQIMPYMGISQFGFEESLDYDSPRATFVEALEDEVVATMIGRRQEANEVLLAAYDAPPAANDADGAVKKQRRG